MSGVGGQCGTIRGLLSCDLSATLSGLVHVWGKFRWRRGGLPPAIFCQPFGLNRNQGSRVTGACPVASYLKVTIGLGLGLDYGRWPKGNGTNPMSWGVSPGYDDYRRWRKNVALPQSTMTIAFAKKSRTHYLATEHDEQSIWPTAIVTRARGNAP